MRQQVRLPFKEACAGDQMSPCDLINTIGLVWVRWSAVRLPPGSIFQTYERLLLPSPEN